MAATPSYIDISPDS
jgi:hypothetical protein